MGFKLDEITKIANERLVTIEKLEIDNGRLVNENAQAYSEIEKLGLKTTKTGD